MAAHRYWRIYITANNGDSYTGIAEVEFRDASDTDLTSPSMTVDQSSFFSSSVGANTVNNSFGSVWVTNGGAMPQWVSYDFGSAVDPKSVAIALEAYAISTRAPRDFKIQYSDDGSSWTDQASITGQTSWTADTFKVFPIATYTVSGTTTEDGAPVSRTVRAYRRDTGELLGEVASNAATGAYTLTIGYGGEVQVVCLDDSLGITYNDQIARVTPV